MRKQLIVSAQTAVGSLRMECREERKSASRRGAVLLQKITERENDDVSNRKNQASGVKSLLRFLEGSCETVILALLYYYVWRYAYEADLFPSYFGYGKFVLLGVYGLLVAVLFTSFDGFKFGYLRISEALLSQWISLFIALFITYWQLCLIANRMIPVMPMVILLGLSAAIAFVCVLFYTWLYHHIYVPKNMAMVFGSDNAVTLKFKMETRPDKYRIRKLIPAEGDFDHICEQLKEYDAVILNDIPSGIRNDLLKYCYSNQIRTYVTPKLTDIIVRGATNINLFDTPLLLVRGTGLSLVQRFIKRAMDLILCVPATIVAAPFMLITALAIKIEDGGPVFFKQERMSLNGKVFRIIKFRSMVVDAEKDGRSIPATEHDPRITKVGRFIRATRIDELPQLLNIIRGDMSIVGPRPERIEHMQAYGEMIPEFDFRTKVKGGLTGYAQIYGKYNTSPYDKLRLDMMYIENYSLLLDIKLILMTLRIMLTKESTEGFDRAEEAEHRKDELLKQIRQEEEEDLLSGAVK